MSIRVRIGLTNKLEQRRAFAAATIDNRAIVLDQLRSVRSYVEYVLLVATLAHALEHTRPRPVVFRQQLDAAIHVVRSSMTVHGELVDAEFDDIDTAALLAFATKLHECPPDELTIVEATVVCRLFGFDFPGKK